MLFHKLSFHICHHNMKALLYFHQRDVITGRWSSRPPGDILTPWRGFHTSACQSKYILASAYWGAVILLSAVIHLDCVKTDVLVFIRVMYLMRSIIYLIRLGIYIQFVFDLHRKILQFSTYEKKKKKKIIKAIK